MQATFIQTAHFPHYFGIIYCVQFKAYSRVPETSLDSTCHLTKSIHLYIYIKAKNVLATKLQ